MRVGDKVWVLARAEQGRVVAVKRAPPSWVFNRPRPPRYEAVVHMDSGERRWYWSDELELVEQAGTQGGEDGS